MLHSGCVPWSRPVQYIRRGAARSPSLPTIQEEFEIHPDFIDASPPLEQMLLQPSTKTKHSVPWARRSPVTMPQPSALADLVSSSVPDSSDTGKKHVLIESGVVGISRASVKPSIPKPASTKTCDRDLAGFSMFHDEQKGPACLEHNDAEMNIHVHPFRNSQESLRRPELAEISGNMRAVAHSSAQTTKGMGAAYDLENRLQITPAALAPDDRE